MPAAVRVNRIMQPHDRRPQRQKIRKDLAVFRIARAVVKAVQRLDPAGFPAEINKQLRHMAASVGKRLRYSNSPDGCVPTCVYPHFS